MARKLKVSTHVVERDDKGNVTNQGVFGPDDDLSKPENRWVEKAITNPDVWEGSDDQPAADPATAERRPAPKPSGSTK